MLRAFSLVAVVALTHFAFCDVASADPDHSFVRVLIDKDKSSVTVSGRSRVDVVAAVLRGLDTCKYPAKGVTVGPWLRLPETIVQDASEQLQLTVCISDRFERGASTAYIAIDPNFTFWIVTAIATELRACGFTDVRLLSDAEVSELMALTATRVPPASTDIACTGDSVK